MSQPNESLPMNLRSTTPAILAIALAAAGYSLLYRLAPAYAAPNMSPIGALCMFSLAFLPARWGAFLPLAVMAVSDLVLYRWYGWAPFNKVVYLCFTVYALAGLAWRARPGALVLAAGTIGSGLFFFLTTNFVVWLGASGMPAPEAGLTMWEEPTTRYAYPLIRYSRDLGGLASCYAIALPFYRNTLLGDALFTVLFFGLAFAAERSRVVKPAESSAT